VAAALDFHLYTWEIVEQIAKDEHVSVQVVSTLDEKARSELEDWLAEFEGTHNLSTDAYLEDLKEDHLRDLPRTAARSSWAEGANFLLPPEKRIGLYSWPHLR